MRTRRPAPRDRGRGVSVAVVAVQLAACGPAAGPAQGGTASGTGGGAETGSSGLSASETSADGTTEEDPCVEVIEGDYRVNFDGLDALRHVRKVTGRLSFISNEAEDLSALACLEEVGGLFIASNAKLRSLEGLDRLTSVSGVLLAPSGLISIVANPALETLAGLESLREVGQVFVHENPVLTSVNLDHVERIGDLSLGGCVMDSSTSFTDGDNPSLTSIEGFASLQSVGVLSINGQSSLTSIAGLQALAERGVSFDVAEFRFNPSLDVAEIDAFIAASGASPHVCVPGDEETCMCPPAGG